MQVDDFNLEVFVEFILKLLKDEDERSRRQTGTDGGDTVTIIDPTPILINEFLEIAFFVQNDQGQLVDGSDLAQNIMLNENELLATVSIAKY